MKKFFLSIHQDSVFAGLDVSIMKGNIQGTLDNFLGMASVFSYPVLRMLDEYDVPVHFTDYEEVDGRGALQLTTEYSTDEYDAIVIDVGDTKECDCSIENISNFDEPYIHDLVEYLQFAGYSVKHKLFSGDPDEEDEAFIYRNAGFRTFTFIIPVSDDFHTKRCIVDTKQFLRTQMCLKLLLNYLLYMEKGYAGGET